LTTEFNPNIGTLIFYLFIVPLSKNTEMENPTLTNEENFAQKFPSSHAKEKDFEETKKKLPVDQS
jgi:hypothetical protein